MTAKRLIILCIALIAAVLLFVVARNMVARGPAAPVASDTARGTVQVLVAKRDLPVGTRLAAGDLTWQPWPATALNTAFITDGRGVQAAPTTTAAAVASTATHVATAAAASVTGGPMEALYGAMVRGEILASEPITNVKLLRGGDGGYMSVVLKPGMRAISIPVSVNTGAGGFILPGDQVDVLQSHATDTLHGEKPGFTVETLLRNVRVLAIDQATQPIKGNEAMVGATATLEVSEADAPVLVRGKAQGELILALRPFGAPREPETGSVAVNTGSVRVVKDGQISEVSVAQ